MVSIDPNEESWNYLQKQLSEHRQSASISNNKNKFNRSNQNLNKKVIKPRKYAGIDTTNKIRLNNQIIEQRSNIPSPPTRRDRDTPLSTTSIPTQMIQPLPGIEPSKNRYNDNYPDLESWGISNNQYKQNSSAITYSSNRFNPSPLLPMYLPKERRPYDSVPKLNFETDGLMSLDNNYGYINRKPYNRTYNFSTLSKKANRADDEYEYFNANTSFSDRYLEEFITKCLRDEIIPDVLIEVISNIKRTQQQEKQKQQVQKFNDPVKDNAVEILNYVDANLDKDKDLFSTKFIDELGYKANIPTPTTATRKGRLPPSLEDELTEIYRTQVVKVDESSKKVHDGVDIDPYQTIDYNFKTTQKSNVNTVQVQFDEVKKLERQLALDKILNDDIIQPTVLLMCKQIAQEVLTTYKNKVDTVQKIEIKKSADNYLIEGFMLDHFLKSMSTHGRYMSNDDDINKLVDTMMMDILLLTQSEVRKTKQKTFQNYPIKKFHINSFINVAVDTLFYELSNNLEVDMKDVDENERKYFASK